MSDKLNLNEIDADVQIASKLLDASGWLLDYYNRDIPLRRVFQEHIPALASKVRELEWLVRNAGMNDGLAPQEHQDEWYERKKCSLESLVLE